MRERESNSIQQTKSQAKCGKCNYKKDLKGDEFPLKCSKCGEPAGAKFDIHEVPITEKDSSRNWTPWIIGGVGLAVIAGLIGLVFHFWNKSKGEKR